MTQRFLGECFGVELRPRGANDPHVVFEILVEDDGQWLTSSGWGSSFWIEELQVQIRAAIAWLNANCEREAYGWAFKGASSATIESTHP